MPESDLYLSLCEVEQLISEKKEDLQREVNQGVRKHSPEGQIQSLNALGGMDALDGLLYVCRLRAGEFAPEVRKARGDSLAELRRSQLPRVLRRRERPRVEKFPGRPGT